MNVPYIQNGVIPKIIIEKSHFHIKCNLSTGELTNEMIGCNLIVSFVNWMYHL